MGDNEMEVHGEAMAVSLEGSNLGCKVTQRVTIMLALITP